MVDKFSLFWRFGLRSKLSAQYGVFTRHLKGGQLCLFLQTGTRPVVQLASLAFSPTDPVANSATAFRRWFAFEAQILTHPSCLS